MDWIQAASIARAGHEIGSHSMNHYDMSSIAVDYDEELRVSREYIESKLPGIIVETFCWPHWKDSDRAVEVAEHNYISARSGNGLIDYYLNRRGGIPSDPPPNMYKVNALAFMNDQSESDWKNVIDKIYENHSWFVSSYHGVDDGSLPEDYLGWNSISKERFIQTINYPMDMGFWMDTFANVSKYIYERDRATLHIKNKQLSIELTLNDALDDITYNQKLSISLNIPQNWKDIQVSDFNGLMIPFEIEENTVFMNILPDGRAIEIKPLLTAVK